MALDANPDLQVQVYGPLIAGTFLQRENARFAPGIFAELLARDARSTETARATGQQFEAEIEQLRLRGGISQTLPSGTELTLALSQSGETSNRAPDQEEARIALSVTQALLRGAGRTVNLAAVERARLDLDISESELLGYIETSIAAVERAYWRFWLAKETIQIATQALEVARKQLEDIQQRIAVGQLARNEESIALAEAARRRQTLIDAEANASKRLTELLFLIAPYHPDAEYTPVTAPAPPEAEPGTTLAERIALAEQSRADLQEARMRLEQRRLDTVTTRNGRMPRLDFFAELAKAGYGPTTGEAWSDISGNGYDLQVGLRLHYTPWRSAEAARHEESQFRHAQATASVENLRLYIGSQVRLAHQELHRAVQQIEASAETLFQQQRTLEAEVERFQVGAGTALLIAQAQRDLLAVMIAEKESLVQARLALLDLHLAEGSLLDRRGFSGTPVDTISHAREHAIRFSIEKGAIDPEYHGPDLFSDEWHRAMQHKNNASILPQKE
jgi:outer membrane protein